MKSKMNVELAKELRLGNIVHHNPSIWSYRNDDGVISNYGKLLEDCFQWNESDWHAIGECTLTLDAIDSVKLTEEILLKCGFITKSVYSNFILGKIELESCYRNTKTNERSCFYLGGNIPDFMKIRIEYLHQLQNLVYALTNNELDVSQLIDSND